MRQLVSEQVGLGQAAVHREEVRQRLSLVPVEVVPPCEEQPPLPPHQAGALAALPEELGPARLVHGGVGVCQDMELVIDQARFGQMHLEAQSERLPHVHADGFHGPAQARGQGLGEEPVQRLPLRLFPHPEERGSRVSRLLT